MLTNCDAYDKFPPAFFKWLLAPARVAVGARLLLQPMRFRAVRNSAARVRMAVEARASSASITDSWLEPARRDAGMRRDLAKVISGIQPRYMLEASERLGEFGRPVLLVWTPEKDFFKREHAERSVEGVPGRPSRARRRLATRSCSEDQPERLAELIADFARERVAA